MIQLFVSDDGIGFDPQHVQRAEGLGLVSMRERLRSVGGEFSIWSKPFLGTQVRGGILVKTKSASKTNEIGAA
jgi:signal transduction histidine kinase